MSRILDDLATYASARIDRVMKQVTDLCETGFDQMLVALSVQSAQIAALGDLLADSIPEIAALDENDRFLLTILLILRANGVSPIRSVQEMSNLMAAMHRTGLHDRVLYRA